MTNSAYDGIPFVLDGEEKELVPSPGAALKLGRQYNGLATIYNKLTTFDPEVYVTVVREGLGIALNGKEAQGLGEKVWRTGLTSLTEPLVEYINLLLNGGRKLENENTESGEEGKAREGKESA